MLVDELLFVLMAVALIAMAVLALIVVTKKGKVREAPRREKEAVQAPEPRTVVAYERVKPEEAPKVEEEPVAPVEEPLASLPPEAAQAPREEPVFEPAPGPIILVDEPEPPPDAAETPREPPAEPPSEPSPPPEPVVITPSIEEPKPVAEEPHTTELRRETESRFFDLRYENAPRAPVFTEPSILDGSPSIEDEEEEAKEPTPGVVTCPHCKSKVPQTLYCIYCGNTLTAKPTNSSK
jgi:hypothetical protein